MSSLSDFDRRWTPLFNWVLRPVGYVLFLAVIILMDGRYVRQSEYTEATKELARTLNSINEYRTEGNLRNKVFEAQISALSIELKALELRVRELEKSDARRP